MADEIKKKAVISVVADTKPADSTIDKFKKNAEKQSVEVPVTVNLNNIEEALDTIKSTTSKITGLISDMSKSFDKDFKFSGLQKGLDNVLEKIESVSKTFNKGKDTEFQAFRVDLVGIKKLTDATDAIQRNIESLNNSKIDLVSFERLEETFKNIETLINSIVKGMNFDAIRPSTQVQEEIESTTKKLNELSKTEERINKLEKKFTSRTYKAAGALILADDYEDDEKQVKDLIGYIEEYIKLGGDLSKFKFNFIDEDEIKTSKTFLDVLERLKEDGIINPIDSSGISNDIKVIRDLRVELESLNKELVDAQIRENRDLNVSLDTKSVEDFSLAITKAVEKVGELHFDIPEGFSLDGLSPENLEKIIGKLDEIVVTIGKIGDLLSTKTDASKLQQDLQDGLDAKPFDNKEELQSLDDIETKVKNITSSIDEKTKAFEKEEFQVKKSADEEVKALSDIEDKVENITQSLNKDIDFNIDGTAITNNLNVISDKLDEISNKKINPIADYSSIESISDESGNTLKWYRGVKDVKSGFMSDKDDGTFFTTNKELAEKYAGSLGKVYEAELKMKNVLEVDVNGGSSELFEYLGTQSDDASIKITELSKSLRSKTGELNSAENELSTLEEKLISFENMPGMSIMANTIKHQIETTKNSIKELVNEIDVLQTEYDKISDDRSNPYGMVGTHDVSSWARDNGLDGVIFNNIKTSVDGIEKLGTSATIFSSEQLNNLKVVKNVIDDLQEDDKPINIPIIPDTSNFRNNIQEAISSDKPIEINISPNIDKSAIEEIYQDIQYDTNQNSSSFDESNEMDKVAIATEDAMQAKMDFAIANEGVQDSVDGSKSKLELEAELMERLAKSAREAADAKKEFVKANKDVKDSVDNTSSSLNNGHSEVAEPTGVKKYKKKGYKAHDAGNHDNEKKVTDKAELGRVLKELQGEIIASIDETTQFVKEITDFYDSADNLVKTQMKIGDKNGSMKTYTTSYSKDKDGNATAWTSHITTEKIAEQEKATNKLAEAKRKLRQEEKKSLQSEVNNALKEQLSAWKKIQSIREKIAKSTDDNEIALLQEQKKFYQEQYINASKVLKSNTDLYDVTSHIANLEQERLKVNANIARYQEKQAKSALSSADKTLFNNNVNYDKLAKRDEQTPQYVNALNDYRIALDNLQEKIDYFNANGIQTEDDIVELNRLETEVKEISSLFTTMSVSEMGTPGVSSEKVFLRIAKLRDTFKGMSKDMRNDLAAMEKDFRSMGNSLDVGNAMRDLERFERQLLETKTATHSLLSAVKDKAFYGLASQIGTYFGFNDVIQGLRGAYQYVAEIDKQMIELEKVSDMSTSRLEESFEHATIAAKDLGSTVSDVISATADWSRLGYDADAAEQLAEVATVYKNVGDGIDINTANESLISTLQGFQMEASQAMEIVDSFNEVKLCLLI